MTTAERLNAIKGKCQSLLAIAEKRSPGEWVVVPFGNVDEFEVHPPVYCGEPAESTGLNPSDAAFIASAAGPFEAALRSTIAAIDRLLESYGHPDEQVAREIIAAWPEDLLK